MDEFCHLPLMIGHDPDDNDQAKERAHDKGCDDVQDFGRGRLCEQMHQSLVYDASRILSG